MIFFSHPLRNGHRRQGRSRHHGHHPRGHPLYKIQDYAEWEEVGKVSHKLALPLAKLLQRLEV